MRMSNDECLKNDEARMRMDSPLDIRHLAAVSPAALSAAYDPAFLAILTAPCGRLFRVFVVPGSFVFSVSFVFSFSFGFSGSGAWTSKCR